MIKNRNYYIRKTHRYLGVLIGIQFLMWTAGGLYFSWNNIDKVHGDHLQRQVSFLSGNEQVVSPTEAIVKLKASIKIDSIHSVRLIQILDKPVYQISYFNGHSGDGIHTHTHYALADATTGEIKKPLSKVDAIAIAIRHVVSNASVAQVRYLEQTNGHSEYRERPLPAWAIDFKEPNCTVYVSAELGTFQSIRHNQWRIFDFLYMLHTMDYETRDDFGNIILRSFSILGLITVLSGFLLFFVSTSWFKKSKPKTNATPFGGI